MHLFHNFQGETLTMKTNRFEASGFDKELVDMVKRDILQTNPNVKWDSIAGTCFVCVLCLKRVKSIRTP